MFAGIAAAFLLPSTAISIFVMAIWTAFGPFFVGGSIRWLMRRVVLGSSGEDRDSLLDCEVVVHFAVDWLNGVLFVYLVAVLAWRLGVFSFFLLLTTILFFVGISVVRNLLFVGHRIGMSLVGLVDEIKRRPFIPLVTMASVGVFMTFIRGFSPPPFQFGWDIFLHSYIANQIKDQSLFYPLPSGFSNSVLLNAYTTSFYPILSVAAYLGQGDVLLLFWIGPLFNLSLYALGIAYLAKRLRLGLPVVLIAITFGVAFHEWTKAFSLVYFAPSPLITALTPTIIGLQLGEPRTTRIWSTHLASISVLFLHFFAGGLLLLVAYLLPLLRKILRKTTIRPRVVSFGLIALALLVILIPLVGWSIFNAIFQGMTHYLVSQGTLFKQVGLSWKITALTEAWYTLPLLGAGLAGSLLLETKQLTIRKSSRGNIRLSYLNLLMLGGLIVYFIELEQTSRFLFLVKPGLVLLAGIFSMELARGLPFRWRRLTAAGIVALILASSSFPAVTFMNRQRWDGDTNGIATSFIDYEMEMGFWIRRNLPQDILLLSDPRTQDLMLPFAMRETLFGEVMPVTDQALLKTALLSDSPETAFEIVQELVAGNGYHLSDTHLVISGRTLFWAKSDQIHIFRPKAITDLSMLEILRPPYFFIEYSIDDEIFLYSLAAT